MTDAINRLDWFAPPFDRWSCEHWHDGPRAPGVRFVVARRVNAWGMQPDRMSGHSPHFATRVEAERFARESGDTVVGPNTVQWSRAHVGGVLCGETWARMEREEADCRAGGMPATLGVSPGNLAAVQAWVDAGAHAITVYPLY